MSITSAWHFAEVIDEQLLEELVMELQQVSYFATSVDESDGYLDVAIYYWLPGVGRCTRFVLLKRLDGLSAEELERQFLEVLTSKLGMTYERMRSSFVASSTDGAAVMTGAVSGLSTRLQSKFPFVEGVNCASHRMALAGKVLKDNRIYRRIESLLHSVYNFFGRSGKRRDELAYVQRMHDLPALKVLRVHDIRWLSVEGVLDQFLDNYEASLIYFAEQAKTEADALFVFNELCDLEVILGSQAIAVILGDLQYFMKTSQGEDVYMFDLDCMLKTLFDELRSKFEDRTAFSGLAFASWNKYAEDADSPLLWDAETDVLMFVTAADHYAVKFCRETRSARYHAEQVSTLEEFNAVKNRIKASMKELSRALRAEVEDRFPATELTSAMKLLDPKFWAEGTKSDSELLAMVGVLGKRYGTDIQLMDGTEVRALVDSVKMGKQLPHLVNAMVQNDKHGAFDTAAKFWLYVDKNPVATRVTEFQKLAWVALTIPIGSVRNERDFSRYNLVCTAVRNRLLEPHLNCCIRASLWHIDYRQWNYAEMYKKWRKNKRYQIA